MMTKVSKNDYYRIINCFTPEEIRLKYGRLVIKEECKKNNKF